MYAASSELAYREQQENIATEKISLSMQTQGEAASRWSVSVVCVFAR
jgi:hypothetical protein